MNEGPRWNGPEPGEDPGDMWPPPGTGQWLVASMAVGGLILLSKMYPFSFGSPGTDQLLSLHYAGPEFLVGELLLFVPLGLLEAQVVRRLLGGFTGLALGLVLCDAALLGLIGETLQYWIPARNSSSLEVLANVLGSAVGYMVSMHLTDGMRGR